MKKRTLRTFILTLSAFLFFVLEGSIVLLILLNGLQPLFFPTIKLNLISLLINTFLLTIASLIFSLPVSVFCATWLSQYAKKGRFKTLVCALIDALSSIPSVVYGLLGFIVFSSLLKMKYSLLSGALTMAVMTLPLMIKSIESALISVNKELSDVSFSLGANKKEVITTILLPAAKSSIFSAIVMSSAKILSESAALLLTSGIAVNYPSNGVLRHLLNSGATLSVGIYQKVLEGELSSAFAISVFVFLLSIALNIILDLLKEKSD